MNFKELKPGYRVVSTLSFMLNCHGSKISLIYESR